MSLPIFRGDTFSDRIFEELSAQDDGPDFELLCEAIGAMFQPVENISGDAEIDQTTMYTYSAQVYPSVDIFPGETLFPLPPEFFATKRETYLGYSILLDINRIPIEWIGFTAQFVGVDIPPGLSDDEQRQMVKDEPNFARCRPASLIAEVKKTLTGTQTVRFQERYTGSAWRHRVLTRTSETPDVASTLIAIRKHKAGPDIIDHALFDFADYQWFKDNVASYQAMKDDYPTYQDAHDQRM